jgi:heme oxygenase
VLSNWGVAEEEKSPRIPRTPDACVLPFSSPVTSFRSKDVHKDSSVLSALRAATQHQHSAAERAMPLSRRNPSLRHYREYLQIMAAWLRPLETWLGHFDDGPQGPGAPPARARLPLILADLADMGASDDSVHSSGLRQSRWPLEATCAYRWGACYVAEGAQLGGAVLYKQLSGRFSPHPLRYLRGGLEEPQARWPHFVSALCANLDAATIGAACVGAMDAFDNLLALVPVAIGFEEPT